MNKHEQKNLENVARDKKFILDLEELLDEIGEDYIKIKTLYQKDDLRPAFYGLPGNIINSLFLHLCSVDDTISQPSWWQNKLGKEINIRSVNESASFFKHSYFIFFLARIETLQRKTINLISIGFDPGQRKNYKKHYEEYLRSLNMTTFIPLFEIATHIRNTVHTNGIFLSHNGEDVRIEWKEIAFVFKHMQPIDFMSLDNWLFLVRELFLSIKEILNTDSIKKITFIEDKFH